jgi:hypothetical protein
MRSKQSKRKTSSKGEVACNGSLPSSLTSGSRGTQSKVIEGREFHNDEKSVYVLAMDDEEKDRLHEVDACTCVERPKEVLILLFSIATLFVKGVLRVSMRAITICVQSILNLWFNMHHRNLLLHNRVSPIFDNEIHVLDVGCGPGMLFISHFTIRFDSIPPLEPYSEILTLLQYAPCR